MQCPDCNSQTVVKCEVAYEQGKSTSTVRALDGSASDVTTLSAFAQRAAPPSSWLKETGGGMAIAGIIWVLLDSTDSTSAMRDWVGWIAIIFALLFIWRLTALPRHFRAYSSWRDTWKLRAHFQVMASEGK